MASRREFLQVGIAALTLPISARAALAPEAAAPVSDLASTPIYKVIFDQRFSASVDFAEQAKALGAHAHAIKGDITDLWFHDLYHRWKQGPAAIAGLTAHGPLFCLERLAWDQRMRVVFRAEHKSLPNGDIEHELTGPEALVRQAAELHNDTRAWPRRMAQLVMRCPAGRQTPLQARIVASSAQHIGNGPDPLFSWVIAPVART
jgi:hypothetical protein